ncbi:MAG: cytochrome c oxidase assembly protein [Actinobacteria bacterium]|nr:cytochrome c oxidase assembly protein [Actinomycetota bacterium]MBV8597605.1 cytochrome c oxidase assembly protein [Actinomycetota bacterium]
MELALQLAGSAVVAALYLGALRRIRRRGRPVPRRRVAAFAVGLAILVGAFAAPLEGRFSTHMLQHLMIGDLAPLFMVMGLNGPLLRPLLALRPVQRLRVLAHPFVSLPVWAANMIGWHIPSLYDAALMHGAVHALQHGMFFACGMLLWSALLEPIPGPRWFTPARKLFYVAGMWIVMLSLSQVFLWSSTQLYTGYSVSDQRAGGGVMLFEGSAVMIGVVVWLLLRLLEEKVEPLTLSGARR